MNLRRRVVSPLLRGVARVVGASVPPVDDEGSHDVAPDTWPSAYRKFVWDVVLDDDSAPGRDGGRPPEWRDLQPRRAETEKALRWVHDVPERQLDLAEKLVTDRLAGARERLAAVELKAARLLTPLVALITGSVAAGAVAFRRVGEDGLADDLAAVLLSVAAVMFGIAAINCLDADTRAGFDGEVALAEVFPERRETRQWTRRHILAQQYVISRRAAWSQGKKLALVMRARAWFARGAVALISGLTALAVSLAGSAPAPGPPSHPSQTPTPTAPGTPASSATPTPTLSPSTPTVTATPTATRATPRPTPAPSTPTGSATPRP